MTRLPGRFWPDTVASRAILILVAALLAFHLLGYWAFRVGAESFASAGRDGSLAERIVSIKRAIASIADGAERDRVAHDLSSASLEVHWSKVSLVLGNVPATTRTREMEARLKQFAPDLAVEAFRVGLADDDGTATDRHLMLVSIRLDDGSWVNFSSSTLGAAQHLDWNLTAIMICFAVGIVVVALLLLRWATRPLRDLALAAERFSLDQVPQPLPEDGPAEVRRAARAFNTMRERIQRLVAERMQAMAAVSHDLRTPITRLRLRSELLDDDVTRRLIDADLGEMEEMIGSTLEYLRGGVSSEAVRPIDLASVIETIVDEHLDQGHKVSLSGLNAAPILGRVLPLKRAFSNVIGNAVKYGGAAAVGIAEAGGQIVVTIEDEGPGIAPADGERVFLPFVRLEESRGRETGGSGLGLTIARAVVGSHEGSIALENRVEGGLRVTVSLPRLDRPAPERSAGGDG
ncbi:ATP-binding protein [Bosea beijingensis]|uniref:ATP-binding protein n=1 Tax=Bosea beijingensis TaxID=3068632 RepID=UPI0027428601|nr:ATP-binding protein [Bosea sp. REN20]